MSKKHYFLFSSLVLVSLVGLVWGAFLLLEPKAIPKIKWSMVKTQDRLREGLLHSLQKPLNEAQFIVLGVPSNEPKWIHLVGLFVSRWQASNGTSTIWVAQELSDLQNSLGETSIKLFDMSEAPGASYSDLGQEFNQPGVNKNIVVTGLLDAASFNEESRGGWLREHNKASVHLLFAEAIKNRESESQALLPCDTSGKKFAIGRLGCDILNLSRLNYRKIKKTLGLGFATSQISERDYLTVIKFAKGPESETQSELETQLETETNERRDGHTN